METASTDVLRRQHMELFTLGQDLLGRLNPDTVAREAADVRRAVARFLGVVRIHAAMENEALYPRLLADPDAEVRRVAQTLLDEVGPIYAQVAALGDRWPTAEAVSADPAGFARDARRALRVLGERVMRETTELYPLVEARAAL